MSQSTSGSSITSQLAPPLVSSTGVKEGQSQVQSALYSPRSSSSGSGGSKVASDSVGRSEEGMGAKVETQTQTSYSQAANGRSDPVSRSASSQNSSMHSPKSSPRTRGAQAGHSASSASGSPFPPASGSSAANTSASDTAGPSTAALFSGDTASTAGGFYPHPTQIGAVPQGVFPTPYTAPVASSYDTLVPPIFGTYTSHSPVLSPRLSGSATSSPALLQSPNHLPAGAAPSLSPALIAALTASAASPAEAASAVASAAAAFHAGFDDKTLAALNAQNHQYSMRAASRTASLPGSAQGSGSNGRSRASTSHAAYAGNAGLRSFSIASQRSLQPHYNYNSNSQQQSGGHYGYTSSTSGAFDRGAPAKYGNNSSVRSSSAYSSFPSERYTAELTSCIIAFLSPILPTEEEYRIKEATRRQLERLACKVSPGSKLLAFGSMANGFALKNSDMDLCCLVKPLTHAPSLATAQDATVSSRDAGILESAVDSVDTARPIELATDGPITSPQSGPITSASSEALSAVDKDKAEDQTASALVESSVAGSSKVQDVPKIAQSPGSTPTSSAPSSSKTVLPGIGRSASEMVTILGQLIREETDFNVMPLPKARIPIIKINRAPTSEVPYEISCDIGFENRLALENTRLLLSYAMVDPPRLRTLVLFLKVWTKRRKLNSPYTGTLSSYGYTLLALYFLIHVRKPAVLPNLQRIPPSRPLPSKEMELNGHNIYFYDDVAALRKEWSSQNSENVGELLIEFFRYFSKEFSYSKEVISIRTETGTLVKDGQVWNAELCIEDPFQLGYNVSRTVTKDGLYTIRGEFMRATRILVNKGARVSAALAELCEEREDIINCAPANGYVPRRYTPQHSTYPRGDTRVYRDLYDVPPPRRYDGGGVNGLAGSFAFEEMARNLGQVQRNLMSYPPTAAMLAPLSHNNGLSPRPAQQHHLMSGRRHAPKSTVHMSSSQSESGSSSQVPDLQSNIPILPSTATVAASAGSSPSRSHAVPHGLLPTAGVGEAFAYGSEISFGSERFRLHPHSQTLALPVGQGETGGPRTGRSQSESLSRSKSLPRGPITRDQLLEIANQRRMSAAQSVHSHEEEGDVTVGADGSALDASDDGGSSSFDSQQRNWSNAPSGRSVRGRTSSPSLATNDSVGPPHGNFQPYYTPQAPWAFMQPGVAQQMAALGYYNPAQFGSPQHGGVAAGMPFAGYGAGPMRGFGSRSLPDASMYGAVMSTTGSQLDSDQEGWPAGEEDEAEGEETGFSSPSEGTLDELARISQLHQESMSPPFSAPFGWSPQPESAAKAVDAQSLDATAVLPRLSEEVMGGGPVTGSVGAKSPPAAVMQ